MGLYPGGLKPGGLKSGILRYLLKHVSSFLASCKKLGNYQYVQMKLSFDTPYSLKAGFQDSYHFLIALGLVIGRQEVFSSTWQLLEQTILTAVAQDFSATVSESQSILIQHYASKHTTFSFFQNSRGFSV